MRANVLTDWEHLEIKNIPMPVAQNGQILVKVQYAGICGSDVTVFHHRHLTATVPRIMCHEILGEVVSINTGESLEYKVGDRVVLHPLLDCGTCHACMAGKFQACKNLEIMGLHIDGGFAEFVCVEARRAFKVSDDIPSKAAILTEPLAVGFHACMQAQVKPGDSVLVIGGGPIGIMAAVNARFFGASKVVVAELNKERLALIHSFGFDVIDSGATDLGEMALALTNGNGFDAVIETSGSKPGALALATVTKIGGKAVLVGIPSLPREYQTNKLILKEIELIGSRCHSLVDFGRTLEELETLYREKDFDFEKMISAEYPLEKLDEALAVHESGKKTGKIIIRI